MSLDYPFYEELRRQKHYAARWWLLGDGLYYVGLFASYFSVLGGVSLLARLFPGSWSNLLLVLGVFVGGLGVLWVGGSIKGYSYRLAERDGISAGEIYARLGKRQSPQQ